MSMMEDIGVKIGAEHAIQIVDEEFKQEQFQPIDNFLLQKMKARIIHRITHEIVLPADSGWY